MALERDPACVDGAVSDRLQRGAAPGGEEELVLDGPVRLVAAGTGGDHGLGEAVHEVGGGGDRLLFAAADLCVSRQV